MNCDMSFSGLLFADKNRALHCRGSAGTTVTATTIPLNRLNLASNNHSKLAQQKNFEDVFRTKPPSSLAISPVINSVHVHRVISGRQPEQHTPLCKQTGLLDGSCVC